MRTNAQRPGVEQGDETLGAIAACIARDGRDGIVHEHRTAMDVARNPRRSTSIRRQRRRRPVATATTARSSPAADAGRSAGGDPARRRRSRSRHLDAVAPPVRADRRRHGRGRDAAHRAHLPSAPSERGISARRQRATPAATHVLKGYFSAMTEGKETTVIYVWDVYDPAGNRLHRIQGQQKAPAQAAKAGPRCRPRPCRRSPTARSTNSPQWLAGTHGLSSACRRLTNSLDYTGVCDDCRLQ